MSTCRHIVRGRAARGRGLAANDNSAAPTTAQTGTRHAPGNVVRLTAFSMRAPTGRPRQPGSHQDRSPHQDYDSLLAAVRAEMGST